MTRDGLRFFTGRLCGVIKYNDLSVTRKHGQIIEKGGILFMGTFHPAALLRQPQNKPEAFADFTVLRDTIAAVCEHTYNR